MEQGKIVWEGKHIGERSNSEYNILLYQIEDLFVEVFYDKQANAIKKFESFTRHQLLDIYLPKN